MLDYEKFKEWMSVLCEMYDKEPSVFLLKGYYAVLKVLTNDQFEQAVSNILENRKFSKLPLPAEIKEMVLGSRDDAAVLALETLEKTMARVGRYRSVVFDDPLIMAAVNALGGWVKLCSMEYDEWKFVRKDFERLYKAYLVNPDRVERVEKLAGFCEERNAFNCQKVEPDVKYIGNFIDEKKQLK